MLPHSTCCMCKLLRSPWESRNVTFSICNTGANSTNLSYIGTPNTVLLVNGRDPDLGPPGPVLTPTPELSMPPGDPAHSGALWQKESETTLLDAL
ncbi:Hypothetical predicted protein, partial [Marmota monax]